MYFGTAVGTFFNWFLGILMYLFQRSRWDVFLLIGRRSPVCTLFACYVGVVGVLDERRQRFLIPFCSVRSKCLGCVTVLGSSSSLSLCYYRVVINTRHIRGSVVS